MDMRERIAREIGSSPIFHWVLRKFLAVKWRRTQEAPEVQERLKALSATAPHTLEQYNAFAEYAMALGNELEKSRFSAWPPGTAIGALLQKLEEGMATASEIEQFRRFAGQVLQNPRCPPEIKERIESALSLLE